MDPAVPSRTALRVALRRAAHQLYDPPPRVLEDPFAVPILGPHAAELHRTPRPGLGRRPPLRDRTHSLALRALLVARSRFAEDTLARAVARGIAQYVLLGAGLDTFALRNPHPTLRVFEVDHPATQLWKKDLLAHAGLPHPPRLTFVPLDFEATAAQDQPPESQPTQPSPAEPRAAVPLPAGPLAAALRAAGHNPALPSVFAWLGVVPYLTLAAFRRTLAFLAAQPAGSIVIFDYNLPRDTLPIPDRLAQDSLAARVRAAGEPFRLFFTPAQLQAELVSSHLTLLEDLAPSDLNALYFPLPPNTPRDQANPAIPNSPPIPPTRPPNTLRLHGPTPHLATAAPS